MMSDNVDLYHLIMLVLCILLSCVMATVLSLCVIRSRLSRTYLYCPPCSGPVGLFPGGEAPVEARPWVEVLGHNVPHNSNHRTIRQDSATFQRLGMR